MKPSNSPTNQLIGEDGAIARRAYQTPRLQVYGSVQALTASGSGKNSESRAGGTGSTGECDGTIFEKPCGSDRTIKENIVRIGTHELGIGLYLFNYKSEFCEAWGDGRRFGVMADEVERIRPDAVIVHPDGYKMVHYASLGIYPPVRARPD